MRFTRLFICAGLAIPLAGCADLVRTNPLDVKADVGLVITASRDTINARNQSVTFTTTASSAFANADVRWSKGPPPLQFEQVQFVGGTGPSYTTEWTGSSYVTTDGRLVVSAWVGVHSETISIPVRQVFGYARFSTPCLKLCFGSIEDGVATVTATIYDSLGSIIPNFPVSQVASRAVSRNASIATVSTTTSASGGNVFWSPKAPGNTWLVIPGVTADSIRVFADYKPASVQLSCPASVKVGSQTQLTATMKSASGIDLLVSSQPVYTWSASGGNTVSITPAGVMTAAFTGTVNIFAAEELSGSRKFGSCTVSITP